MIDPTSPQESENGVLISDNDGVVGPLYTGGPINPIGLDAPINTIYVETLSDGVKVWRKFGLLTEEWAIQDNMIRKSEVTHDLQIPEGSLFFMANERYDCEIVVKGEGVVL